MRLQAGAKYPSSELVDCCACPCGRWSACLSAQASQRHDHNPADAQMLALRRAVRAHATPWPQQWSPPPPCHTVLTLWRALLHNDMP
jgi:hypothetical protein